MAVEKSANPILNGYLAVQGWMRRLYDWVLHWADTPYGGPALFLLAFMESSFFPIPPDVLLIALAIGMPKKSFRYALVCALASAFGGVLGYYIGYGLMDTLGQRIVAFYGAEELYVKLVTRYAEVGWIALATAGFTPIPYKIFTIASGALKMNLGLFVTVSILSRSARFFLVGTLIYFLGEPVRGFIDKHFNRLTIAFTVLLILGFVVIKYLI